MGKENIYYLVDYENVGVSGLNGAQNIAKNGQIHLFSTENNEKISMSVLSRIPLEQLVIHPVPNGLQSLDKHLVSYLGYLIGQNPTGAQYVIVSRDAGYDAVIQFWKKENGSAILRQESLGKQLPANASEKKKDAPAKSIQQNRTSLSGSDKRRNQVSSFFGQHFKEKKYQQKKDAIIEAVLTGKTKTQVNVLLQKSFPNAEVKIIYERLKPLIEDLPGQ